MREEIAAPAEPIGLAVSPDDATLLVTSGWGQSLTAYALTNAGHLEVRHTWAMMGNTPS